MKIKYSLYAIFSILVIGLMSPNIIWGYRSAGIVPIYRFVPGNPYACLLFRTNRQPVPKPFPQPPGGDFAARAAFLVQEGIIFADLGGQKQGGDRDDAAMTAARAFFQFQSQYKTVPELRDAIARQGTRMDMGDHITYFMPFDQDQLPWNKMKTSWPVMVNDLYTAIQGVRGTRQFNQVLCHDPAGVFLLIHNKFAEGLANDVNFSKLQMLATGR